MARPGGKGQDQRNPKVPPHTHAFPSLGAENIWNIVRIGAVLPLTYFDEGAAGAQQLKYRGTVERHGVALETAEPPVRDAQPLDLGTAPSRYQAISPGWPRNTCVLPRNPGNQCV